MRTATSKQNFHLKPFFLFSLFFSRRMCVFAMKNRPLFSLSHVCGCRNFFCIISPHLTFYNFSFFFLFFFFSFFLFFFSTSGFLFLLFLLNNKHSTWVSGGVGWE